MAINPGCCRQCSDTLERILAEDEITEADQLDILEMAVREIQIGHSRHSGARRSICPWTYFTDEHARELHAVLKRMSYADAPDCCVASLSTSSAE